MYFVLYRQAIYQIQIHISIWEESGLYQDILGLFLAFQLFLLIFFFFSTKYIIFVRLLHYNIVLFYMQFNKRKPVAGYYKLHRLLYFIRAVELPTPVGSRSGRSGKQVAWFGQPLYFR